MIFRYFKVYIYDLHKKIPPHSRLWVRTIHREGIDVRSSDFSWVKETSFQGFFTYKEGSLNEGVREVTTGGINCWEYKNLESAKYDIAKIIKDWGKKEAKNIFMIRTIWLPSFIDANFAIRDALVNGLNIQGLYGGFPFCKLYNTVVSK